MAARAAIKATGATAPEGDVIDRWFADVEALGAELGEFASATTKAIAAQRRIKVAIITAQRKGVAALRTGGHGQTAVDAAASTSGTSREDLLAEAQRAVRAKLRGENAETSTKLARLAVEAMTALRAEIDGVQAKYRGPRSMAAQPSDLTAAIQRSRVVEEIKALGCVKAKQIADDYLTRGDSASFERWMDAACDVAQKRAGMAAPILAKELGLTRPGDADNERLAAIRLLQMCADYRLAQTPPTVKVAEKAFAILCESFTELLGFHARWFSVERWRKEGYTRAWPAFEVDPDFLTRRLPPMAMGVRPLWMPT